MIRRKLITLIGIVVSATAYAQVVWEKCPTNGSSFEPDGGVYVLTNSDMTYAMGAISTNTVTGTAGTSLADTITFNANYTGTFGTIYHENSSEYPYEITITKEDNGYYSLKTEQGYLNFYNADNLTVSTDNYFGVGTELLSTDKYYWSIDNTTSYHRIVSYANDEYLIRYQEGTSDCWFGIYKATYGNTYLFRRYTPTDSIEVTIGNSGFATLYYGDTYLMLPYGVNAYSFKYEDSAFQPARKYTFPDIIPAKTAVVLRATPGTYSFYITDEDGQVSSKNILRGTDVDTQLERYDENDDSCFYMLSLGTDQTVESVGFYWGAEDGGPFVNKAHKAYFKLPKDVFATTSSSSPLLLNDIIDFDAMYEDDDDDLADKGTQDEATGIKEIDTALPRDDDAVYNLCGMRVAIPLSGGIYIRNGKKYIMK